MAPTGNHSRQIWRNSESYKNNKEKETTLWFEFASKLAPPYDRGLCHSESFLEPGRKAMASQESSPLAKVEESLRWLSSIQAVLDLPDLDLILLPTGKGSYSAKIKIKRIGQESN